MENKKLNNMDKAELIGQIIDKFEDFLEARNVKIENNEHEGDEGEAIIYGSDYDELRSDIEDTLRNWELI